MTVNNLKNYDLELLKQIGLFSQLDEEVELPLIWSVCEHTTYKSGSVLLNQGQLSQCLYVILRGEAKVSINGIPISSILLKRGGILGEVEFFNALPCSATAETVEKTDVLTISYLSLRKIIELHPRIGLKIYHAFTLEALGKLKAVTDQMLYLSAGDSSVQLAHGIRSPLAALRSLSTNVSGVDSDEKKLISLVIDRIDSIASTLLGKDSKVDHQKAIEFDLPGRVKVVEIENELKKILAEKNVQHKFLNSIQASYSSSCKELSQIDVVVNLVEFGRIMSNLIDNSVQASDAELTVHIGLKCENNEVIVCCSDNGKGIPLSVLSKIGKGRISFGKKEGSGLGLFHAFKQVESWGGKISIDSQEGKGTTVCIVLPGVIPS